MEVSGQLHVPAALQPGEKPPVLTVQDAGPALDPVWTLPLTGIELRIVRPTALLLYRLRYRGS